MVKVEVAEHFKLSITNMFRKLNDILYREK